MKPKQKRLIKKAKRKKEYQAKKKRAIKTLARYKDENGCQKESSIEKKVRLFLEKNNIPFIQEYAIKHTLKNHKKELYRKYDFYVSDGLNYTFYLELDGSYFHAEAYHEGLIPKSKLNKMQRKNILNDSKKNRIAEEKGVPLLRFWESTINKNFKEVERGIFAEIKRQKSIHKNND